MPPSWVGAERGGRPAAVRFDFRKGPVEVPGLDCREAVVDGLRHVTSGNSGRIHNGATNSVDEVLLASDTALAHRDLAEPVGKNPELCVGNRASVIACNPQPSLSGPAIRRLCNVAKSDGCAEAFDIGSPATCGCYREDSEEYANG
jgi:hypothetical protein